MSHQEYSAAFGAAAEEQVCREHVRALGQGASVRRSQTEGQPVALRDASGRGSGRVEEEATIRHLQRLAAQMTTDAALQQDLVQEAWLHWWRCEQKDPGRNPGWYLQSCRYHLSNWLRQGRSVDSWKRRHGRLPAGERGEIMDAMTLQDWEAEAFSAPARPEELSALLVRWLTPRELAVVRSLQEGLSARATSRRLGISHTLVNRHRRRIAALIAKLGWAP